MSYNEMFVPDNINDFYTKIDSNRLYQGDILDSSILGLKNKEAEFSPDYWMIITKDCDLDISIDDSNKIMIRRGNVSIIALLKIILVPALFQRYIKKLFTISTKRIAIIPLVNIFLNNAMARAKKNIENLIKGKMSKYHFIPPDGSVLLEPNVIDFEIVKQLDASEVEILKRILQAKKLQLASPFRHKIAQCFALHYSSIGIEDTSIKDKNYIKSINDKLI